MAIVIEEQDPTLWDRLPQLESSVFVIPTDTVYGISCAFSNRDGRQRIQKLKQSENGRFIVLVPDMDAADEIAEISPEQRQVLDEYWPGPITFILKRRHFNNTIALRMPTSPLLQNMMVEAGPILSTSCNLHGETPIANVNDAVSQFSKGVDFFIDGGPCENTQASTVVDLTGEAPKVIREGAVAFYH